MDQNGVKMVLQGGPTGSPRSPKLVQAAARLLQKAPSGAKRFPEAPRWPQEAPKCPQDGPKMVPRGPQMEPDGARWEQNGDQKQCNLKKLRIIENVKFSLVFPLKMSPEGYGWSV